MAHELRETVLETHDALELRAVEREISLTLVPGAGMVGASLTHEGRELLHQGGGLAAWTEHGKTFGVPLLSEPPEFVLAGGGGALRLRLEEGYHCAQVYSPRGADFICFEPMTAATDALRRGGAGLRLVAPGEALTARWSLLVEGRPGA